MSLEGTEYVDAEACIECLVLSSSAIKTGILLLQGPAKCGKSMFCRNFVRRARYVKRPMVYVTADEDPNFLQREFSEIFGGEPSANEMRIVDCYSWRLGSKPEDNRFYTSNTTNLSDLSITLQKAMEGLTQPVVIIDSLNSVAIDAGEDACLKCLRMLLPRIRAAKGFGLFTVSEGVHSTQFANALRTTFDGIIEMKVIEENESLKRLIRIYALKGGPPTGGWTTFEITDRGIRIGTPLYRAKMVVSTMVTAVKKLAS